MFIIKNKQLAILTYSRSLDFERRLKAYLLSHYPILAKSLEEDELMYFIKFIKDKAVNYGLDTEYGIMLYFNAVLILGNNFENNPENNQLHETLLNNNISSRAKEKKITQLIHSFQP